MRKRKVLRLEKKIDGVKDDNSGDDDTGEVRRSWRRDESGEADQDVAVEVSEEVDSRSMVMRSEMNDW